MRKTLISAFFVLTVVALCFLGIQCSRGTAPAESTPLGIVGTWDWVYSASGPDFPEVYADSVSYTQKVIFTAQKEFQYYYNDVLVTQGAYKLKREPLLPLSSDTGLVIHYDGNLHERQFFELQDNSVLVLYDLTYDGHIRVYVRVQ